MPHQLLECCSVMRVLLERSRLEYAKRARTAQLVNSPRLHLPPAATARLVKAALTVRLHAPTVQQASIARVVPRARAVPSAHTLALQARVSV